VVDTGENVGPGDRVELVDVDGGLSRLVLDQPEVCDARLGVQRRLAVAVALLGVGEMTSTTSTTSSAR